MYLNACKNQVKVHEAKLIESKQTLAQTSQNLNPSAEQMKKNNTGKI